MHDIKEIYQALLQKRVHTYYHPIVDENEKIRKPLHDKELIHNLTSKIKFDISSHIIFDLLENRSNDDYEYFLQFIDEFKALGIDEAQGCYFGNPLEFIGSEDVK